MCVGFPEWTAQFSVWKTTGKDCSEACTFARQNCAVYSVFPSGMTSHSKIAQFNWEFIAPLSHSIPLSAANSFSRLQLSVCNPSYLLPTVSWMYVHSLNLGRTAPNCPQLTSAITLTVVPKMFRCNTDQSSLCTFSDCVTMLRGWLLSIVFLVFLSTCLRLLSGVSDVSGINPLNAELNPICYLLALLGAHHFLHVSRIRVKSLTLGLLMSYIYIYIYGAPILDVSRSQATTHHSR